MLNWCKKDSVQLTKRLEFSMESNALLDPFKSEFYQASFVSLSGLVPLLKLSGAVYRSLFWAVNSAQHRRCKLSVYVKTHPNLICTIINWGACKLESNSRVVGLFWTTRSHIELQIKFESRLPTSFLWLKWQEDSFYLEFSLYAQDLDQGLPRKLKISEEFFFYLFNRTLDITQQEINDNRMNEIDWFRQELNKFKSVHVD
jgi:hypothetical protein